MVLATRTLAVIYFVFLAIGSAWASSGEGSKTKNSGEVEKKISEAIEQLGDDRYEVREKATMFLWSVGKRAEKPLKKALESSDPEVMWRSEVVLEKLRYGITPATPPEILTLIENYRYGDTSVRFTAINELLALLSKGRRDAYPVLLALARNEKDQDQRQNLMIRIPQLTEKAISQLLVDGEWDIAEEILELGALIGSEPGIRNYVAYLLLRGKLDQVTARLVRDSKVQAASENSANGTPERTGKLLVYSLRASGDLQAARRAARKLADRKLEEALCLELGDWKALAKLRQQHPDENRIMQLGLLATYQRLAKNESDHKETIAEVLKLAEEQPNLVWNCAEVLLLNDRPQEAVDLLTRHKSYLQAFELLSARREFAEALALAEKARTDQDADLTELDLARVRTLVDLGEKREARAILVKIANKMILEPKSSSLSELIRFEQELGLEDLVFEHGAFGLQGGSGETNAAILASVFPDHASEAETCWKIFRQQAPDEELPAMLLRLRELLSHKLGEVQLEDLASQAKEISRKFSNSEQMAWLHTLGEAFRSVDRPQRALEFFEEAVELVGSSQNHLRVGDQLMELERWQSAAERYRQAWEQDRTGAVPLYLHGWALGKAGRKKEGQEKIELARLFPLANESARFALAEALQEHGLFKEARRERDFFLSTCQLNALPGRRVESIRRTLQIAAMDSSKRGNWLEAADWREQGMLSLIGTGIHYTRNLGYLVGPGRIHRNRAKGLLSQGNVEAAMKEARICMALLPSDISLALALVPLFDRRSENEKADEFFSMAFDRSHQLCQGYPRSAHYHNDTAWLAARCHRRLSQAQELAERAVELEPDRSMYIDTLAEVHFHRGNRQRAIELAEKCLELDPKDEHLEKQLERFRTADVPDTSEIDQ